MIILEERARERGQCERNKRRKKNKERERMEGKGNEHVTTNNQHQICFYYWAVVSHSRLKLNHCNVYIHIRYVSNGHC